ncbi:MAG: SHOCT domain-containing protein [Mucilaginibacter sp.]
MDPSFIFLIYMLHGIAFAAICSFIGTDRNVGPVFGAIIGFLLGVIGLIIVLLSTRKEPEYLTDELQKYRALFDNGLISEKEYNRLKEKLFDHKI